MQRGDFTDKTFDEAIAGVRRAERGVEVREDLAQGFEYVKQYAEEVIARQKEAVQSAETATAQAKTATEQASTATSKAAAAASSATAAANSQTAAKASETESAKNLQGTKEYFEQVRTITIGAQGWYATPEALVTSVPVGENGWWAVVGTTDTIWTWDSDTGAWKDSIQKADLSDYYTHLQTDQKLSDLKAETDALLKAMQTKLQKQISAAAAITASGKGYIRFSDGTQICWNTAKLSYSRTYYFFAFPVPFIDTTYAVAGMKTAEISDTDNNGFYFDKKTTDRVEIKSAHNSYNENPYSTLIVIGRWK